MINIQVSHDVDNDEPLTYYVDGHVPIAYFLAALRESDDRTAPTEAVRHEYLRTVPYQDAGLRYTSLHQFLRARARGAKPVTVVNREDTRDAD